ncbi:hypothetical protein [Prescottella equi]|uniref:hypothetical protein n=1 Tax=Rhodococcus hoagii TaxID=43767 RepID=UPI000D103E8F|nr:hypothetical protein [Prescottella equi]AVP71242.1 hypothetical protein C7H75_24475 [Prescottella equi]
MADAQGRSRTVGKSSGKHIEKGIKFRRRNVRSRRHLARKIDDGMFIAPGHVAGVHYDVPKAAAKPAPKTAKTSASESAPDRVQVMAARLKVQLEDELGIKSEQRYIDIANTPVAGDPPGGGAKA